MLIAASVAGQNVPPQAAKSPPPSPLLAQAEGLLGNNKNDAALEILLVLYRTAPVDPQINHFLALAFYQKSDYARAVKHFSVAVKQPSENSKQYRQGVQLLGLSQYFQGHLPEAIPYLEQAAKWSPDNVENAYVLGLSYMQTHNVEGARRAFALMFKVAPDSASAYLINAQMMLSREFEEFAEQELQRALELDPKLPQANYLAGELAIYRAHIDHGIELLQKEIAINPTFGMAYYRLGEAYTRQLKWDEAVGPLQKSIWLNPFFSGPYIVLGKVYLKKNDLANAEGMLRSAVKMDPNNFSGHHLLAQVLQQANRQAEAQKEFALAEQLRTAANQK